MSYAFKLTKDSYVKESLYQNEKFSNFTFLCWIQPLGYGQLLQYSNHAKDTALSIDIDTTGHININVQLGTFKRNVRSVQGGINNGSWYHLAVVNNESILELLINGKAVNTDTIPELIPIKNTDNHLLIGNDKNLSGEIRGIQFLNNAITINQDNYLDELINTNEETLYSSLTASPEYDQAILTAEQTEEEQPQKIELTISNLTDSQFNKIEPSNDSQEGQLPEIISAGSTETYCLYSNLPIPVFTQTAKYIAKDNPDSIIEINVKKSLTYYESEITSTTSADLERGISISKNKEEILEGEITIGENLVILNAKNLRKFIKETQKRIGPNKIISSQNHQVNLENNKTNPHFIEYNKACQIFNRRIHKKPLAIIYCTSTEDVAAAYQTAIKYKLPVSIRSGGHDHEGECSGTDTILIDLMGLNHIEIDKSNKIVRLGPGNRFITLTTALANQELMIPHGTCATVAIPGFIMGGGWGPWTRSKGMCCEHLIGAEIVLGNGDVKSIQAGVSKEDDQLLWALKGGGGMSYGIVTQFTIQAFDLPRELVKFELEWNPYQEKSQILTENHPTLSILTTWEDVIASKETPNLVGTNLKINGKPLSGSFNSKVVKHNCVMYGYWQGSIDTLHKFIKTHFTDKGIEPDHLKIDGTGGIGTDYGANLMSSWDRESYHNIKLMEEGKEGTPFPPDLDEPAPHKITSRLVNQEGLGDDGHAALLSSLTSPLILEGNRSDGLFNYVTLGAIVGDYYDNLKDKDQSSFPYKDKLYTIQYQTWWNLALKQKEELQNNNVYTRTNRALDWMEVSRDFDIPNTSGAFISFKDDSIPTETYFAQNYGALKKIKEKYSQDDFNHLRKRKTII